MKPNEAAIPKGNEAADGVAGLDKSFGFSKHFGNKFAVFLGKIFRLSGIFSPKTLGKKNVVGEIAAPARRSSGNGCY